MNSMDDSTEEEIHIDPKLMNEAFQRGLRQGKLSYLNQLKSRALVDYELQDDEALIGKAFELMRKFIGTQGTHVNHLSLRDWEEFGLSKHVINRLGYIAFQLDSASPVSKPTRRGFNRVPSSKNSDEVYDDDFEELEEIEEDNGLHSTVSTVRNNYSHVEDTNISTDFGISDSVRSGDSKRGEDDDDIVDETIQYSIHKPALKVTSSTAAAKPLRPRSSVEPVSSKFEMEIVPADPDDDVAKRAFTAGAQRRGKTATWIVNNEWRMGDKIGSGSFGEVYQGMNDRVRRVWTVFC